MHKRLLTAASLGTAAFLPLSSLAQSTEDQAVVWLIIKNILSKMLLRLYLKCCSVYLAFKQFWTRTVALAGPSVEVNRSAV